MVILAHLLINKWGKEQRAQRQSICRHAHSFKFNGYLTDWIPKQYTLCLTFEFDGKILQLWRQQCSNINRIQMYSGRGDYISKSTRRTAIVVVMYTLSLTNHRISNSWHKCMKTANANWIICFRAVQGRLTWWQQKFPSVSFAGAFTDNGDHLVQVCPDYKLCWAKINVCH